MNSPGTRRTTSSRKHGRAVERRKGTAGGVTGGIQKTKEVEDRPGTSRCSYTTGYTMGPESPSEPLLNNAAIFAV